MRSQPTDPTTTTSAGLMNAWKRYAYTWITLAFLTGSIVLHLMFGCFAYVDA